MPPLDPNAAEKPSKPSKPSKASLNEVFICMSCSRTFLDRDCTFGVPVRVSLQGG